MAETGELKKRQKTHWPSNPVVLGAGVIVVWALIPGLQYRLLGTWEERGQFGDMFGSINSLFTGLAFAGLLLTIHLQRKELGLQRDELQLTREELSRTAKAQEDSGAALTKQAELMMRTARISALNATIGHYALRISSESSPMSKLDLEASRMRLIAKLEAELAAFDVVL